MFSMFEVNLQDRLCCINGFDRARKILDGRGEVVTKEQFDDLGLAINVLKHGCGRSYDTLIERVKRLPFRVMLPDESFFFEGDVSEVSILVKVDDAFIQHCSDVIKNVSDLIC